METSASVSISNDEKNISLDMPEESGLDRLVRMYGYDKYGLLSPELYYLTQGASSAIAMSAIAGAFINMMKTRDDFFRQNVASTFESQYLARRKLTDTMTLNAFRGAFQYSVKYGAFSGLYLLSTMTIANYNNKVTVWDHIGTGGVLGALFRINYGLKGMAAAGCLGGFLGLIAGGALVLFMRLNNFTLDDLHNLETDAYYRNVKRNKLS